MDTSFIPETRENATLTAFGSDQIYLFGGRSCQVLGDINLLSTSMYFIFIKFIFSIIILLKSYFESRLNIFISSILLLPYPVIYYNIIKNQT